MGQDMRAEEGGFEPPMSVPKTDDLPLVDSSTAHDVIAACNDSRKCA